MQRQKITVNSRKYDHSIRRTWQCQLIEQTDSLIFLVGEFDRDVEHANLGSIRRGTVSYEYFWFDRCYNIFCFREPDGTLRNYYCNIAMPPIFEIGVLDYVDLDIDILVWPDHSYEVVDRDDFERNSTKYNYPAMIKEQTEASVAELIAMIERREFPFDRS
jgi:protein associated with RNAse G/E